MTYSEYDRSSNRHYRVVAVDSARTKFTREYAPEGSPEEKSEWLSAQLNPLMRQRRFRLAAWLRGLRKSRPNWIR